MSAKHIRKRNGLTLIELLIVVAIIGLLLQLVLPAIESSREAARQVHCKNNLRQLAIAFTLHHDTHQRLPSGGWGYRWAPDPDGGTGDQQPGGWAYSLLPYHGEEALFQLGFRETPDEKRAANKVRLETPVALHYCPSRRLARAYPVVPTFPYAIRPLGSDRLDVSGRIDYAANAGGNGFYGWGEGPDSVEEAKQYTFFAPANGFGIVFPRSAIQLAQITDGASKTYLVGEKYMDKRRYKDGFSGGDDQGPFVADDRDSSRVAGKEELHHPRQDEDNGLVADSERFGSAHPAGFFMAFCDGSVRRIAYDIDVAVHRNQANRSDEDVE